MATGLPSSLLREYVSALLQRSVQLTLWQIYTPEVAVVQELPDSMRGAGGFGSTGGFGINLPPINGA